MASPTQSLCTLRDIDELGIGQAALSKLSARHKRNAIRAASGRVAAPIRKRHKFPLKPVVVEFDDSGLTVGSASYAETSGPSTVADVVIKVILGGAADSGIPTYQISTDAGVNFGATTTLPSSGEVTVDGVVITFSGTLIANETISWMAEVDGAVKLATATIAAWLLLNGRGVDPKTQETLNGMYDATIKSLEDIALAVLAELPGDIDATPELDEGGPYGDGQQNPWDWQYQAAGQNCGC